MSKLLITIGLMAMVAFSIVLFITFATAYLSPSKTVNVRINSYNEAEIEMALMTLLLPVSILAAIFSLRNMDARESERYILREMEARIAAKAEKLQ